MSAVARDRATGAADALDRLFARVFAIIAVLSWIGMLLAEIGWFRPLALLAVGVTAAGIGLVLVDKALRQERPGPTPRTAILAVTALAAPLLARSILAAAAESLRGWRANRGARARHWGLVTYPIKCPGPSGIRLAARLVLAQLANAAGFVSEAVRGQSGLQASSRVP